MICTEAVYFLPQVSAYGEAFDSSIKVEVSGDMEAARKLIMKEEEPRPDIYSESDNDQDQQEVRNNKGCMVKLAE